MVPEVKPLRKVIKQNRSISLISTETQSLVVLSDKTNFEGRFNFENGKTEERTVPNIIKVLFLLFDG